MMFADDIVLCVKAKCEGYKVSTTCTLEKDLRNQWRRSMEDYKMKISRTKGEYMSIGALDDTV